MNRSKVNNNEWRIIQLWIHVLLFTRMRTNRKSHHMVIVNQISNKKIIVRSNNTIIDRILSLLNTSSLLSILNSLQLKRVNNLSNSRQIHSRNPTLLISLLKTKFKYLLIPIYVHTADYLGHLLLKRIMIGFIIRIRKLSQLDLSRTPQWNQALIQQRKIAKIKSILQLSR